ncbi:hypothetical protein PG996_009278 [Apiospora saccharicola]|uniref:Uncharacterized protein n=1 Tax=Apiospora saccharicola TaxID=335842 RepID=A0ABR1UKB9_9PEZI
MSLFYPEKTCVKKMDYSSRRSAEDEEPVAKKVKSRGWGAGVQVRSHAQDGQYRAILVFTYIIANVLVLQDAVRDEAVVDLLHAVDSLQVHCAIQVTVREPKGPKGPRASALL